MFMHMPKKWGVPVLIAVAVCLGAYYWMVVASERVGDWRVYQGSGCIVRDAQGGRARLDLLYTVRNPAKPLFSYTRLDLKPSLSWIVSLVLASDPLVVRENTLVLTYRSEWPTTLLVVVTENDGMAFQRPVKLEHSDDWSYARLPASSFEPRTELRKPGERHLDFARVTGRRVDFYDGSGVTAPSTLFSNRLELFAPAILPVRKPENAKP